MGREIFKGINVRVFYNVLREGQKKLFLRRSTLSAPDPVRIDSQDGGRRHLDHPLCHASRKDLFKPFSSMRSHYYQVDVVRFHVGKDLFCCIPKQDAGFARATPLKICVHKLL